MGIEAEAAAYAMRVAGLAPTACPPGMLPISVGFLRRCLPHLPGLDEMPDLHLLYVPWSLVWQAMVGYHRPPLPARHPRPHKYTTAVDRAALLLRHSHPHVAADLLSYAHARREELARHRMARQQLKLGHRQLHATLALAKAKRFAATVLIKAVDEAKRRHKQRTRDETRAAYRHRYTRGLHEAYAHALHIARAVPHDAAKLLEGLVLAAAADERAARPAGHDDDRDSNHRAVIGGGAVP